MAPEDIKEMFKANAALKHMPMIDPNRQAIEQKYLELLKKYESECIGEIIAPQKQSKLDEEAVIDVLVRACQNATLYELQNHPSGMTDEDVATLADTRRKALDYVVNKFVGMA